MRSVSRKLLFLGLIVCGLRGFKTSVKFLYSGFRYTCNYAALVMFMGFFAGAFFPGVELTLPRAVIEPYVC